MAKFTAGPGAVSGIDFTTFDIADLAEGDPTDATSTHYKLEVDPTDYNEFFGTGFTYNTDSELIGGTLNEIVAVEGTEVYRVSGLSMSVATASKFVDKGDSQAFLAAIFAGADSITVELDSSAILHSKWRLTPQCCCRRHSPEPRAVRGTAAIHTKKEAV